MDMANTELIGLRSVLRKKDIRILSERLDEFNLEADYLCRGYQGQFKMMMQLVKPEVELRMRRYLGLDVKRHLSEDALSLITKANKYLLFQPPVTEREWFQLIK